MDKLISEVLIYEQPTKYLVTNKNYLDDKRLLPVLTAGKSFILGYTDDFSNVYNKGDVIIIDDFTLDMKFIDFDFKVKSSAIKLLTTIKDDLKFIYNSIKNKKISPIGHNRHYISLIQNMLIKIPSLPEQQKIARFFSLLDKQIELWERKLQLSELAFKFYLKNSINGFVKNNNYKCKKLSEICSIKKGTQIDKHMLVDSGYKYLNGGKGVSGYCKEFNTFLNTITISEGGNSCGFINFNDSKIWAGCHLYVLDVKQNINKKFIYFILKNSEKRIMRMRVGSGLPNIQINSIRNFYVDFIDNIILQNLYSEWWDKNNYLLNSIKNNIILLNKLKLYYLNNLFL